MLLKSSPWYSRFNITQYTNFIMLGIILVLCIIALLMRPYLAKQEATNRAKSVVKLALSIGATVTVRPVKDTGKTLRNSPPSMACYHIKLRMSIRRKKGKTLFLASWFP